MSAVRHTSRKGARGITLGHRLNSWLLQHVHCLLFSLGQFCRNPLASLLTAAVIGIALALPAGFYVALDNARRVTAGWEGAVQITAFLKMEVSDARARELATELERNEHVGQLAFMSRDEALAEFRASSGFGEALDALADNPLPALLLLTPRASGDPERSAIKLLAYLRALPEVEAAQYDQQWLKRLNAIIHIIQRGVIIMAVFLGLAVLIIVGNTIRMLFYHRRAEIEIAKLFGATDSFIRRPFLYSGFWYGLSGGLLAWLVVIVALRFLENPAGRLAELYTGAFALAGLKPDEILVLVGAGILLGLIGSWVSVSHHLKATEPA